jgi:hypothetical protein
MPDERMSEEEIERRMKELEEDPPEKLEDWPKERDLRMQTFGGREGTHGYDEGIEQKLGPSDLRHHEDGSVTIEGEEVDDPEQYKGEPIRTVADDPEGRAEREAEDR